jgi:membrane protein implicated in regulation of membrane protease activity
MSTGTIRTGQHRSVAVARFATAAVMLTLLGVAALYAFLVVLGAVAPGKAVIASVVVAAIAAVWVARGVLHRNDRSRQQDVRLLAARERRGF